MRKSFAFSSLALAATLALTACGSTPSGTATAPSVDPLTPAAATSAPATPEAKKSTRGNIIKELGQPAGQTDSVTKKQTVNFTVDAIAPATCNGAYPQPAENGHLVALSITAETTPELAESSYPKFDINPSSIQFVGASGTTFNGNLGSMGAYSCLADEEEFPQAGMGPGEKVSAKVIIDVPEPTGTIVIKSLGGFSGWEYKF